MIKSRINPKVDEYSSKAKKWQKELEKLRMIILDCQLIEKLKRGVPWWQIVECILRLMSLYANKNKISDTHAGRCLHSGIPWHDHPLRHQVQHRPLSAAFGPYVSTPHVCYRWRKSSKVVWCALIYLEYPRIKAVKYKEVAGHQNDWLSATNLLGI